MADSEPTGLRLLVLDGGDIRCLSQMSILEEFLHRVQWKRESDEILLPCDYFHMICATGPAGIIVIFLVVFQMSIEEARDEFVHIWNAVFSDDNFSPEERSLKLERIIEELLGQHDIPLDRKLLSSTSNKICKAFVCVISPAAPTACQKLRTYRSPQRHIDVSIIEAFRATCANPARFISVKVEPSAAKPKSNRNSNHVTQEFIAGDTILQNPTREAIKELHEIYGAERRVACVLSLGCGRPSTLHIDVFRDSQSKESWRNGILQAERVAEELDAQMGRSQVYYRFSVDRGLESPDLMSLSNIGVIETHTGAYLQQTNASRDMQNCVRASEVCSSVSTADLYCVPTRAVAATHGLPPLCASFVMRQEVMDSMARYMFDSQEGSPKIMILSGMGGSGKTQLISKFARTHLSRFQHVLFIDARTTESIKNGVISRVRSLGGICTTLNEAVDLLAQVGPGSLGHWFLILDNADDPTLELGPMIPNCENGFVAIATRNPTAGDLNPQGHIKLDVMSEEEALQALLRTVYDSVDQASDDDHIDGLVLIKELGFLPVAIVQAGSYIKRQGRGRMKDYLEKLKLYRQKLLSIPAKSQLDIHHHAVYATLDVTLDVLSSPAKNLLGILACFNYTGLPLPLLDRATSRGFLFQPFELFDRPPRFQEAAQFLGEIFNPVEMRDLDILAELEQFSLVVRVENYSMTTLRFHPLTHSWMFDRIAAQEEKKYWDAAMRLFVSGTAEEDEDLFQHLSLQLDSLAPTEVNALWDDLAAVARLRVWSGNRDGATTIWETIYHQLVKIHGAKHLRTSAARLEWALSCDIASSPSILHIVLAMVKEVINVRSQLLPLHHHKTLEAMSSLLELKITNSRVQISDEDLSQQIHIVKCLQQYPKCISLLLKSQEVLAMAHQRRKEWDEAEKLILEVTRERVRIHGASHLTTLRSKQLLVHHHSLRHKSEPIHLTSGGVSETISAAEKLQKELVTNRIKYQGPHHIETLKAQQSLGELYEQTGQHNLALITRRQIVEGYRATTSSHDEKLLDSVQELILSLEATSQWDEAIVQWQEIIGVYNAKGDDKGALQAKEALIKLLATLGRQEDVITQWDQWMGECKEKGEDRMVAEAMESLVHLFEKMGHDEARDGRWRTPNIGWSPNVVVWAGRAVESLAKLLEKMGRHDDAVARWEQWIEEWKAEGNSSQVCQAMESLAELLEKMGRPDDAVVRWEQAIVGWRVEGNNSQAIQGMESLAGLLEKMGRLDDAVARWEQAIAEWKVEGTHWHATEAMEPLAKLLEKIGKLDDAMALWEQVIGEWKAEGNNRQAGEALGSLAELLEKMGRLDDAAVARWEQKIAEWKVKDNNWQVTEAMESLAKLLEKMERLDDAVARREQWIEDWRIEGNNDQAGQAMKSLAELLEKMGRHDDAVARWEQWIEEWKAEGNIWRAIQAMKSLAELLEKMGRLDDAVARWEQDIAEWKVESINWPATKATKSLAELLEKMGRLDDAMARWEQAIVEWKVEGDNWQATEAMKSLAKLLEKMGRLDDAVARWEQVIEEWNAEDNFFQSLQSLRVRKAGRAMKSLAELLEKMGRLDDAMAWRKKIEDESVQYPF